MKETIVPTLCFHSIRPSPGEDIYAMDTGKFAELMGEISGNFGTTSLGQIERDPSSISQEVLITFDDGYSDHVEFALPILRKYGVNALFFLLPGYLDGNNLWDHRAKVILNHLSDSQVRDLIEEEQTLGSHGMSHQNVVKLDADTLRVELEVSKSTLEDRFQVNVSSFAYPYGDFNESAALVAGAVYPYSFATDRGTPQLRTPPNTAIKRLSIRGNQSIPDVMNMVVGYGTRQ